MNGSTLQTSSGTEIGTSTWVDQPAFIGTEAQPPQRTEDRIGLAEQLVPLWDRLFDVEANVRGLREQLRVVRSRVQKMSEEMMLESVPGTESIIRMRPVREYSVRVRVRTVEKATPPVVEPGDFDE